MVGSCSALGLSIINQYSSSDMSCHIIRGMRRYVYMMKQIGVHINVKINYIGTRIQTIYMYVYIDFHVLYTCIHIDTIQRQCIYVYTNCR